MSKPTSRPQPVRATERVVYWDVLRGVAVLGVLMANMPLMSMTRGLAFDSHELFGGLDAFGFWFVRVFADTKFITIFSVLFGAGLALMSEKAIEREAPFKRMYFRRLVALAVFGAMHGILLWWGDILFHYALMGLIAMWMRKLSPATLLIIALALLSVGLVINLAFAAADPEGFAEPGMTAAEAATERSRAIEEAYGSGSFVETTVRRWQDFLFAMLFMLIWAPRTLGLFLVGMALVRSGVILRIADHRAAAERAVRLGFPIGVLFTLGHVVIGTHPEGPMQRVLSLATLYLLGFFLSPAYMGLIALWTLGDTLAGLQRRLAAVGRMAFTNYISHSVITGAIFIYGRQWDQWNRFEGLLLTFGIYLFQMWLSPRWLAHFRFGPLEWLWRSAAYWKLQPMQREAAA